MITVHHLETSRSQRILWLLEELGLPYQLVIHRRNPLTRLAPPELKAIHPLGKSPVIVDDGLVVAESGAIIEYIAERYGSAASGDLGQLLPPAGSPAHHQVRFWMHYAEGSLMNWLVMKLVFMTIPTQPMPFFVRPIARVICRRTMDILVDPNVDSALAFMESHLQTNRWFAGEALSIADFQMSFAVEAALAGIEQKAAEYPALFAYRSRMQARPGWQRALEKGGPVIMSMG